MDRREYLGLTGTSIVALLGGCSSSGSQSTATATETRTDTAAATLTRTATSTSTPTEVATTTTVSEDDTQFEVDRPFDEFVTQELMEKPRTSENDDGEEIPVGYDPNAVGPYTEHFAETVLSQMGNIPSLNPSMRYRDVVEMAAVANWTAKNVHRKTLTPEQSFLPTSLAIDNTVVNVVDANFNGPTTLLAQRGDTSPKNILNHEELENWLNDSFSSENENKLASTYVTNTDPERTNTNYRWLNLDSVERDSEGAPEEAIGGYLIELGKGIPDFYPRGRVPVRPQLQPHRSFMKYADEQVVDTVEDEDGRVSLRYGNLNGVKGEMNHAIYVGDVDSDELAVLYADSEGQVHATGQPYSALNLEELWADDDMIPISHTF